MKTDTFAFKFADVDQSMRSEGGPGGRKETPVVVATGIPQDNLNVFTETVVHMLRDVKIDEITKVVVHVVTTVEFDQNGWCGDG